MKKGDAYASITRKRIHITRGRCSTPPLGRKHASQTDIHARDTVSKIPQYYLLLLAKYRFCFN
jgi:hypothetical protein